MGSCSQQDAGAIQLAKITRTSIFHDANKGDINLSQGSWARAEKGVRLSPISPRQPEVQEREGPQTCPRREGGTVWEEGFQNAFLPANATPIPLGRSLQCRSCPS